MEKHLPPYQEAQIERFHCHLQAVETVDDIFPPDGGVREPLTPPLPGRPGPESLCLTVLTEICIARQRREALKREGEMILETIDELTIA